MLESPLPTRRQGDIRLPSQAASDRDLRSVSRSRAVRLLLRWAGLCAVSIVAVAGCDPGMTETALVQLFWPHTARHSRLVPLYTSQRLSVSPTIRRNDQHLAVIARAAMVRTQGADR